MGQLGGRAARLAIPGAGRQGPGPAAGAPARDAGRHSKPRSPRVAASHIDQLPRGGRRGHRRADHRSPVGIDEKRIGLMTVRPTTPGPQTGSLIDPKVLMTIRNLELRARVVVEGFWSGLHRSPYHGFSVEFTEYRSYTPGDDPRYLDWRVFARSDRYFIKKFEDETNLRCHLLVDNSRSMTYGSRGYSKAQYAATLAATLAYFLYLQGDAVGLLTFDEQIREYL